MTVNDELQNALIRHQHYVERVKASEVKKMLAILVKADDEISAILAKAGNTEFTKRRAEAVLASIRQSEADYAKIYEKQITSDLAEFGNLESAYGAQQIKSAFPVVMDVATITDAQLWAAAQNKLILLDNGVTMDMKTYINRMFTGRASVIEQTITQGYVIGKTPAQVTRDLLGDPKYKGSGNLQQSRNWLNTMVRTSYNHMSSVARDSLYEENDDIIKGYKWVSTLDARTSPICRDRDGDVWYYGDNVVPSGVKKLPYAAMPPAHYGCRSTTTPITKSYKELGLDIADLPESDRASMNGQVPASTTYNDWLKTQTAAVQKDVLGAERYALYKSGDIKIDQFIDDGRLLTIKELSKKYNLGD